MLKEKNLKFQCDMKGYRVCPRCNSTIQYITKNGLRTASMKSNCRKCKNIPDEYLKDFCEGKYIKRCPRCNGKQEYNTKIGLVRGINLKLICKGCTSRENALITQRKIKIWRENLSDKEKQKLSKACSIAHLKVWNSKTEKEKQSVIKRLRNERDKWYSNLWMHPEEYDRWITKLKKSFEKYRGENHWMNRVDTMAKIHSTYMKYLGKNHWVHRPGILKKILASRKHNKYIKENCGEI